ncbi:MAG TPA: metal-dependent transcriptional regulator, partial [bacterium]|nr:metal-dependent transcriptional regulator [bacterium]
YLEAVFELGPPARVSAIAGHLGVAKASVTQAVQRLAEKGLVESPRYGRVNFTARGLATARKVRARHSILLVFLEDVLGVPHATANRDACILEHGLSAETTARLSDFVAALQESRRPGKRAKKR